MDTLHGIFKWWLTTFEGEASWRRSNEPSQSVAIAWNVAQQWRRARGVEDFKDLNLGFLVLGTFDAG